LESQGRSVGPFSIISLPFGGSISVQQPRGVGSGIYFQDKKGVEAAAAILPRRFFNQGNAGDSPTHPLQVLRSMHV